MPHHSKLVIMSTDWPVAAVCLVGHRQQSLGCHDNIPSVGMSLAKGYVSSIVIQTDICMLPLHRHKKPLQHEPEEMADSSHVY